MSARRGALPLALILLAGACAVAGWPLGALGADALPAQLATGRAVVDRGTSRAWTIPDIVQVGRITGIAVQGRGRDAVAFILEQPSIADNRNHYGLYEVSARESEPAHKIAEGAFLAEVQWRPGTETRTFLGDLGQGVQLYQIGRSGPPRPLVVNREVAPVGGYEGLVVSCCQGERLFGVLDYGWSPDGAAVWYTKLQRLSKEAQGTLEDRGGVFDDSTMSPMEMTQRWGTEAVELHVFHPATGRDRLLATAPGDRASSERAFLSPRWVDSRHLAYAGDRNGSDGGTVFSQWIADTNTGQVTAESGRSVMDYYRIATREGNLTVRQQGASGHLVALSARGAVTRDFGSVSYTRIENAWRDDRTGRVLLSVHYPDHDGLASLPPRRGPPGRGEMRLSRISDELSDCAFNADLTFGACNRESRAQAPELVAIEPDNGEVSVLAQPNLRYGEIRPLHIVQAHWTNRFGATSDGYITYPRHYQPGRRYPTIVVTHAHDAKNRFAYQGFQWDYPIQVLAERGYFVLSVNEAAFDSRASAAAWNAYGSGATDVPVSKMQLAIGYEAVATMEAAAKALIEAGMTNPKEVGIAGYSRGSSVTTFTLSQSKLFRAGESGDASWFSAGGYWSGDANTRAIYRGLFGGSPLDPKAFPNYLAFSPSARAADFSGPLLQQYAADDAASAVELGDALQEAGVPTELVFYPHETHLLHQPRHRAWAEQLSLQWFDYWLLGRRDVDPIEASQYRKWDAMAGKWHRAPPGATSGSAHARSAMNGGAPLGPKSSGG